MILPALTALAHADPDLSKPAPASPPSCNCPPAVRAPHERPPRTSRSTCSTTPQPDLPTPPTSLPPPPPPPSPGRHLDHCPRHHSRQQYMDSLLPPSGPEFARLARLQDDRERERKQRDRDLCRQSRAAQQGTMEARRDFMQTKAIRDDQLNADPGSRSGSASQSSPAQPPARQGTNPQDAAQALAESLRSKAALVIQRSFRGYRVRREMKGLGLDASTRWTHAIRDAQWQEITKPRPRAETQVEPGDGTTTEDGDNRPSTGRANARQNWAKVATIARRAGGDEDSSHSDSSWSSSEDENAPELTPEQRREKQKAQEKRRKHAKMMGLQYFLEMVDQKHRYGSNLRTYHEEWKKADTNENFFYWLDYGDGRLLDLATCPRERLDREQVRYLSREERQYYLAKVDAQGRLVWAKNGVRIDTTEAWKDSIHGIVPADDPTPAFSPEVESHSRSQAGTRSSPGDGRSSSDSASDSASSCESELEAARAAKYANPDLDGARGIHKVRHVSAATIFNKLLRKSVRRNTWIFVADTSFRLYVGIKSSGAFQHSSFLQGSRIAAAGLLKVRDGRLSSLSPLSGHYRPPAANFRAFVHSLEAAGADMHRVSISRSYAVLVGLEAYTRTRRRVKDGAHHVARRKQQLLEPQEAARRDAEALDQSASARREREVLAQQQEKKEDLEAKGKDEGAEGCDAADAPNTHGKTGRRWWRRLSLRSRGSKKANLKKGRS